MEVDPLRAVPRHHPVHTPRVGLRRVGLVLPHLRVPLGRLGTRVHGVHPLHLSGVRRVSVQVAGVQERQPTHVVNLRPAVRPD